jgi:Transposase DDE domain group 1
MPLRSGGPGVRTSPHAGRYQNRKKRRFFQTSYAAASWSKPRKIVARVEANLACKAATYASSSPICQAGQKCSTKRSILIKDMKLYTRSDRSSCHRWEASQFRLFLT